MSLHHSLAWNKLLLCVRSAHGDSEGIAYIGWDAEALAIRQGQEFAVIKNTVEILHPLRVDVTIKYDPLSLAKLTPHIVNDPGGNKTTSMLSNKHLIDAW